MAEALAAFGIACNVMQVIGCAIDLCHVYRAMSDKGSGDSMLASKSDSLRVLSGDLKQSIKDGLKNAQYTPQDRKRYQELEKIAKDSQDKSRALLQELMKIAPRSQSPFHKATASVKVLWHGSKIAKLEKEMKSCEDIMTSKILVHLFAKSEAAQVQQQADFTQMNDSLQYFIVQYANGYTKLQDLLAAQSDKITDNLKIENAKLDQSMQRVVLDSANETVSKVNEHADTKFSSFRDTADTEEAKKRLFRSLKYESMNQRKNQINQAYEKTLSWALSSDSLIRKWLISNEKLFWITGKAGSGKSTLMKFLIYEPQTLEFLRQNREDVLILSYFHWSAGGPDQSSFHSLLCSLALQALQANTETLLLDRNPRWKLKDTPWDWSTEELEAALDTIITSSSYTLCLFIDGLDEFRDDGGAVVLVEFLRRLMRLGSVRLLVSSRPEQYFSNKLEQFPKFSMEDMTKEDIAKMVTDKMTKCVEEIRQRKTAARQKCNISDKTVAKLEETLITMADGVFLWVHFVLLSVLDGLENDDDLEDLLARLQNTPRKLEDLYSDMLTRSSSVYHQYAGRVFHLILELPILELEHKTSYKEPEVLYQQTILTYAAILESDKLHSILRSSQLADAADQIELLCQNAARAIVTKSLGLVEAKSGLLPVNSRTDSPSRKDRVTMIKVELIHQTARTFLEGSAAKPLLQAGTISKADTYKGLFYSGLALSVVMFADEKWNWQHDSVVLAREMLIILSLLSPLLSYDEWYPLPLLLYHIGQQSGLYPTIGDFFFTACDFGFYKLVQDLLGGHIQLVERNRDPLIDPQPDLAYKSFLLKYNSRLLRKVLYSALREQGLVFFIDISTTLKDSVSLIQYLLENGADPNEPQGHNGNLGTPVWSFVNRLNNCTNDLLYREANQRQSGRQDLLIWLAEVTSLLAKHGGNFKLPLLTMWQVGGCFGAFLGPPFILAEPCTYRLVVFEDNYASLVQAAWLTLQDGSVALQPNHMELLQNLFDQATKRRPVLVAKIVTEGLFYKSSTYTRGYWLGELARLGHVDVVPVDQDEEIFTKLDKFMDPQFLPHSKEQIQWFDTLVELTRTPSGDETERNAAIMRALEAGQIREPDKFYSQFQRKDEFAFDPLSTGLKFFVPPHSAHVVESCMQKDYHFEKLNYKSDDFCYPLEEEIDY